ncbi:hypothetical protein GCM10009839_19230 [Catenulispora yoronensis]|uniref:Golvesin/Xly CBD-like domain-containing protein n=1 Tax=Catenulispora yoronensis TaxID=450799 RepID=A0ABP5FAF3_9ACTN
MNDPDHLLPPDWRSSSDRAVQVVGNGDGLHVLVADSKDAYQWRQVTTLSEPGLTEDQWIGNACLTGSGSRLVVSYAPRQASSDQAMFDRGAFTAIVDLGTGKVTKLPVTSTLAYFSPGCGAGETAVLTQENSGTAQTRLITVDAAAGTIGEPIIVAGQLTSAVPIGDRIVAAQGASLRQIDRSGATKELAKTAGQTFDLHPDASGAVVFVDQDKVSARVKRLAVGKMSTLATGPAGTVGATGGASGRVFITGKQVMTGATLPSGVSVLPTDVRATVSDLGRLAVTSAMPADMATRMAQFGAVPADTSAPAPFAIHGEVVGKGSVVDFLVDSDQGSSGAGTAPTPALLRTRPSSTKAQSDAEVSDGAKSPGTGRPSADATPSDDDTPSPTDPTDADRACSIERNDVGTQVYQPTPNQVEWAVDDAVRGVLTVTRSKDWKNAQMPADWTPQGLFPSIPLVGAGGAPLSATARVPAQVMLGLLAQESNLWQATGHALPGQYGNPLIANFYGAVVSSGTGFDPSSWVINWAKADCGYGIGQVTDGMRRPGHEKPGETALPADKQRAIAVDYATNIAASLQILESKWNELQRAPQPLTINNDDPSKLENWFAALWDYNLGFNPPGSGTTSPSDWGLGWGNNPANPNFPPNRHAFLDNNSYSDAGHPQDWPYEEKVLGWAAWPIDTGLSFDDTGKQNGGNTHGYQAAWWNQTDYRTSVKPPLNTFCDATNGCDPANPPQCTDHACFEAAWFKKPVAWKTCNSDCGSETMTYKTLRSEPGDANTTKYPTTGDCDPSKAPAGTQIVSNQPTFLWLSCPVGSQFTSAGTFKFQFSSDANGEYEAKEDLHQLSVGFGGHTWFAHTRDSDHDAGGKLTITGVWMPTKRPNGWTRVLVHVPAAGATTQQAHYVISLGDGNSKDRYIDTHLSKDTWVSLGVFNFVSGAYTPAVSLSNSTLPGDGTGSADIAWDAVGFQPLAAKPKDFVVQMGDSYSSGEGAEPYLPGTDVGPYASIDTSTSPGANWNACRRSQNSWIRLAGLPKPDGSVGTPLGTLADSFDNSLDYHTVACSGAFTYNIGSEQSTRVPFGTIGQYHEVRQIDSGFLDTNTTVVALTVSGNDAGFADVLTACGHQTCPSDADVKAGIDRVVNPLRDTLQAIHGAAPNAKIILMGYPELAGANMDISCSVFGGIGPQLNSWADYLEQNQLKAVNAAKATGVPVTFYWGNDEFYQYRICDGDPQGINDLVAAPTGPGDFSCPDSALPCPSMESFHANNTGTKRYALAFQKALASALP